MRTSQGQDFADAKEYAIENAKMPFGKYKGENIVNHTDTKYFVWLRGAAMYKGLGKFEKEAVKQVFRNNHA